MNRQLERAAATVVALIIVGATPAAAEGSRVDTGRSLKTETVIVGPSGAARPQRTEISGATALAAFDLQDGCIHTRVSVFGNRQTVTESGTTSTSEVAAVAALQADECTGGDVHYLVDGFGQVEGADIDVAPDLSSTRVRADLMFANHEDGTVTPMHVDVLWTATGRMVAGPHHDVVPFGSTHSIEVGLSRVRDASAAGVITFRGTDLLPQTATSAEANIAVGKVRTIIVEHGRRK